MSIDISRKQGEKVREDLNVQRRLGCLARDRPSRNGHRGMRFFFGALRGTGPRTTGTGCVFFVVRGPVLRNRSLILAILIILAILLQTRELLRSYGPFLLVAPMFYRHSGLPDLFLPHPGHPDKSWKSCFRLNTREGQAPARWAAQNSTGPRGPECL